MRAGARSLRAARNKTEAPDNSDTVFLPKTDFPMKAGLPQKEPGILARWQADNQYRQLREKRKGREKFILHDGPPYANGDMHIGHALNHILKDMVARTQTLLGKDAPYVPGWDCHGLPIEWKVEEQYRKKKLNKDEVPVKEFRAECRAYAQQWVDVQREQLKRLGIGGDWDNPYLTMDFAAEATIVTELMKFAESGQLYRGAKPVMWSPVEKTALAEAEVEYEDITSTQIDVAFEITHCPNVPELVGAYAVIWTTTPWTIPVNQAIAYGPDVEYRLCHISGLIGHPHPEHADRAILVAINLIPEIERRWDCSLQPLIGYPAWSGKGSDLAGTIARHPMAKLFRHPGEGRGPDASLSPEEAEAMGPGLRRDDGGVRNDGGVNIDPTSPLAEFFLRPRPFLPGDFVTTDSGTGLVHMAPDHGEDDFDLCKRAQSLGWKENIEPVFAVTADGKYREDWAWLGGQGPVVPYNPKGLDKLNIPEGPICEDLRKADALISAAKYDHSYPHSWRSKAKVIYRCTPQWFVPMGDAGGLREKALAAIDQTTWVPDKGKNRIRSMVVGRPDWVLSRQRAWGVPITLFVDRKTGQYLCDAAVNARIIAAVREVGVDAWCDERAQEHLGADYRAEDYERVVDILDVWFDSGCTHAFVLESGKWPDLTRPADHIGPWADLYLEGSDQHRGWFQSSLLESCGTRGHAPYKAVLTHGFTMDAKGMKMSKSLGNTISPTDLMRDSGADILRLWALTVDFTEDHRIGKEILSGVSDQYRKLRNTFRYMLGALDGFSDAEKVPVADMPELELYVLHLLADMDAKLAQAVDDFDFNTYVRLITDFANNDLSAFFFDIRKDSLYCDAVTNPKRMAYRTVLDILFHALVRYAAPVLVFTAEEVWGTRFPDAESVHFSEWPDFNALLRHPGEGRGPDASQSPDEAEAMGPGLRRDDELVEKWTTLRSLRSEVSEQIEPLRRNKIVGSSLEAKIILEMDGSAEDEAFAELISCVDFAEIAIVASVEVSKFAKPLHKIEGSEAPSTYIVTKTTHHKCGRCWRHLPEVSEDGTLCNRCEDVVNG